MKGDSMSLNLSFAEDERVASFKKNEENMRIVQNFVDELIALAKTRAEAKLREKNVTQQKPPITTQPSREVDDCRNPTIYTAASEERIVFSDPDCDLKRRLGTRARGFMTRLVDVICHCANTARAAAANATNR